MMSNDYNSLLNFWKKSATQPEENHNLSSSQKHNLEQAKISEQAKESLANSTLPLSTLEERQRANSTRATQLSIKTHNPEDKLFSSEILPTHDKGTHFERPRQVEKLKKLFEKVQEGQPIHTTISTPESITVFPPFSEKSLPLTPVKIEERKKVKGKEKEEKESINDAETFLASSKEKNYLLYVSANNLLTIENFEELGKLSKDEVIKEMINQAKHLASLPTSIDESYIITTSQLLYHQAARSNLLAGNVERGFELLAEAAQQAIPFSPENLSEIEKIIKMSVDTLNGIVLNDVGTWAIKDQAIRSFIKTYDNEKKFCWEIKLNGQACEHLQQWLEVIIQQENLWKKSLTSLIDLSPQLEERGYRYEKQINGKFVPTEAYELPEAPTIIIDFKNLGQIIIPHSHKIKTLADQIEVIVEVNIDLKGDTLPQEVVNKVHMLLSIVGCPPALVPSRNIDKERLVFNQLFNAFFPDDAKILNKQPGYFNLSLDALKTVIIKQKPEMNPYIKEYIDNKKYCWVETLPGKKVLSFNMSDKMRQEGALGLMLGLTGPHPERTLSLILKVGLLSSQLRYSAGNFIQGSSVPQDYQSGGAESVFTRLVTKKMLNYKVEEFAKAGHIQLLIDLKAVNPANSYGHRHDAFGSRTARRVSLKDLTFNMESSSLDDHPGRSNEVMIRDYIAPHFIKKIVVQTEEAKENIISRLIHDNIVEKKENEWHIKGLIEQPNRNINDFIIINDSFNMEMWK
ncbi:MULTISPECIES: hypothetical protein [unclassified Neochlamydia]|uniref:hypothetical protein n=1 Tax=unclassified Neochlamydia TaxID=2643326 RepID=UPI00140923E0|nr:MULTISPECIES: hypothetical protein [unclassified Neochlamydia]